MYFRIRSIVHFLCGREDNDSTQSKKDKENIHWIRRIKTIFVD